MSGGGRSSGRRPAGGRQTGRPRATGKHERGASGRHEEGRTSAKHGTLNIGPPLLGGSWDIAAFLEVLKRVEGTRSVAYLLISDGLSEKCVFFPVGGLRLTSVGARRGTRLSDAIEAHPKCTPDMIKLLQMAHADDEQTLEDVLSGPVREIAKECSRKIVIDELVDLAAWDGAEFEYRESNPPPQIFDAELEAVKLSLGVAKTLAHVRERAMVWRQSGGKLGVPSKTRLRVGKKAGPRMGSGVDILAAAKQGGAGGCTLEDALLAARRGAAADIAEAGETILSLRDQQMLAVDVQPPKVPDAVRKKRARQRADTIESALDRLINQLAARRKLAEQYQELGDQEKAIENLRVVGEELQARQDLQGAIGVYNNILELSPMAFFAREQVAGLYEALKQGPSAIKEWLKLARDYAGFRLFNRAQERLRRAIRLDPKNTDLRRYLIDALLAINNKSDAVREYEALAKLMEEEGRHDEALACYQQIAALEPKHDKAAKRLTTSVRRGPMYFVPYLFLVAGFLLLVAGSVFVYTRYEAITAFDDLRAQAIALAKARQFTPARQAIEVFEGRYDYDPAKVQQVRGAVQALEEYEARSAFLAARRQEAQQQILAAREAYQELRRLYPETKSAAEAKRRLEVIALQEQRAQSLAEQVLSLHSNGKYGEAFAKGRELLRLFPWSEPAKKLTLPLRLETTPRNALVEVVSSQASRRLDRRTPCDLLEGARQPFRLRLTLSGYAIVTLEVDLVGGEVRVVTGNLVLPKQLRSPLSVPLPKQLRWRQETLGPLQVAPSVRNGDVLVASSDQRIYRWDAVGKARWRAPTGKKRSSKDRLELFAQVSGPPLRAGKMVVVAESDGDVRGLDLATGTLRWRAPRKRITGRGLHAVGVVPGGPVILATRKQVIALDPRTGHDAWRQRVDLPGTVARGSIRVDAKGAILAVTTRGRLLLITGKGRRAGRLYPLAKLSARAARPVGAPISVPGGCLVALEGKRLVYAWDQVRWKTTLEEQPAAAPLYADQRIYVPCGRTLVALGFSKRNAPRKVLWSRTFDAPLTEPAFEGSRLYVGLRNGKVYSLSPDAGKIRWYFATGDELLTAPVANGGTVFVASTDCTLYAIADEDN